jgi:hypothetical protein
MDGVCRDAFVAEEVSLRRENVAVNAASLVNRALWCYALLVVLVTTASWAGYEYKGDFETRPLFAANDQFRDLTNYIGKTAHLNHGAAVLGRGDPVYTYPAPAAFVYKALIYTVPGQARLIQAWQEHQFQTLIFLKARNPNGMECTYYPKVFLDAIRSGYVEDDSYPHIAIFHRRADSSHQ